MLTSGDLVVLDLGTPRGREAGLRRPAVVVTAQRILDASPNVVHVVPVTGTDRGFGSEVVVEPDQLNQLDRASVAQCQHLRSVSVDRLDSVTGNVGPSVLAQLRQVLALILDTPT